MDRAHPVIPRRLPGCLGEGPCDRPCRLPGRTGWRGPRAAPARLFSGATLIELLIALGVAAFLAFGAVPAFVHTVAAADRTSAVNGLVSAVQLARQTAITRRVDAVLCRSSDGAQCLPAHTGTWAAGVLVFANEDGDSPPRVDPGEAILKTTGPFAHVTVTGNRDTFSFRGIDRRSTNGTLVVCDRRGEAHARAVVISWTGRPRIAATHADGTGLTCPP